MPNGATPYDGEDTANADNWEQRIDRPTKNTLKDIQDKATKAGFSYEHSSSGFHAQGGENLHINIVGWFKNSEVTDHQEKPTDFEITFF
ncbi:MAG: hypothetical protein Q4G13_01265 [Moraxella sp.]|nr:hypothetical protein [Moraxella sp.]